MIRNKIGKGEVNMTMITNKTNYKKFKVGTYDCEVKNYKYTSRPPVAVFVSGTILGESNNICGEPCYFYKSANAMSISEGIQIAKTIIKERLEATR